MDASYAVHNNMRSHTGGWMSLRHGVLHLIGVCEYLPFNIWLVMFPEAQGYYLEVNTLWQDNQSAIKMEKNGRNSCTGNSRHINIRYFIVKDRVDKGELSIDYCPTEAMLADLFTKPLQGQRFHMFRDVIMGSKPLSNLMDALSSRSVSIQIKSRNVYQTCGVSTLPFTSLSKTISKHLANQLVVLKLFGYQHTITLTVTSPGVRPRIYNLLQAFPTWTSMTTMNT